MKTAAAEQILHLSPDEISVGPQPRQFFDKDTLAELAADIKERGLLQPVLVRRDGEGYRLITGERRLRASKLAGVATIRAVVQEMAGSQVLEAQLVENCQREDLHPLEVAEGYRQLRDEHGLTVEQIAERVKRKTGVVRNSLKLCDLTKPGKEALLAGALSASSALHVARVPTTMQAKLVKDIAHGPTGTLSDREVRELVRRDYMLDLTKAPFDPADATLCPSAGACGNCPKRTGAQPELFFDVSEKDLCTDPPCHREKVSADWKAKEAAAAAGTGPGVVPMAESKRIFDEYDNLKADAPYLKADASCYEDTKYRTYRALLGKGAKAAMVMARTPKGEVVELLPKKGLKELLDDAGKIQRHEAAEKKPGTSAEDKWARELEAKKAAIRKEALNRAIGLIVAKVESVEPDKKLWRMMATELLNQGVLEDMLERRFPGEGGDAAKKWAEKASEGQLRGFAFEGVMEPTLYPRAFGKPRPLSDLCEAFKVDLRKLEADVKSDAKTKAAEEAKAAKMAPAEALFAKKGDGLSDERKKELTDFADEVNVNAGFKESKKKGKG